MPTKQIWIIREELSEDGKNPSAFSHYRFHEGCNALQHVQCFVGVGFILEMSERLHEYVLHANTHDM